MKIVNPSLKNIYMKKILLRNKNYSKKYYLRSKKFLYFI